MAGEGKNVQTFKVPTKPAPKSRGRKVLDEDSFISEMEKIIEADFFPDLKSLRLKSDYLEAMEAKDYDGMRRAYVGLKRHRASRSEKKDPFSFSAATTPTNFGDTPKSNASSRRSSYTEFDADEVALGFGDDTPMRSDGADDDSTMGRAEEADQHPLGLILRRDVEDEMEKKRRRTGLDAFLEEHVSEDTESFRALMEKSEAERRRKKSWMFDPPLRPGETTKEQRLALPGLEEQADQTNRPTNIDADPCPVYNAVLFVPEGQALTGQEKLAAVKPVVRHEGTRFKTNPFAALVKEKKETGVLYKRTGNKGEKIGVDGKVENDGEEPEVSQAGAAPSFDFVSTPKIRPDDIDSPLMTWGHVVGTPLLLDGPSRAGTPSFRMAPTPKRDQLAEKLAQRAKASQTRSTPRIPSQQSRSSSSFLDSPGMKRATGMSPAAHHLMTRKLGITPKFGARSGSARSGSSSVTKTPRTPGSMDGGRTPTPTPRRSVGVTLARTPTPRKLASGGSKDNTANLTDNLLNLPL